MMPSELDFFRLRAKTTLDEINSASSQAKQNHVTTAMGEDFNDLLNDLKQKYPDVASGLPKPISLNGAFSMAGSTDITYLDLSVFLKRVLAVIDLLESQK